MNKKILFFIGFIMSILTTEAQSYKSMFDSDNSVWTFVSHEKNDAGHKDRDLSEMIYFDGKTTINGKEYRKMYVKWMRNQTISEVGAYMGCVREENGKVYTNRAEYDSIYNPLIFGSDYYESTDDGELILYDFTLTEGDTVPTRPQDNASGCYYRMSKRDVMKFDDGSERGVQHWERIIISDGTTYETFSPFSTIVEGIGCLDVSRLVLQNILNYKNVMKHFVTQSFPTLHPNLFMIGDTLVYQAPDFYPDPFFSEVKVNGIENIEFESKEKVDTRIFNIGGQQLSAPQRGINIIGGKKVYIR